MKEKVKVGDIVYYAGQMRVDTHVVGELMPHGAFWTAEDSCRRTTFVSPYTPRWFKSKAQAWEYIRDEFTASYESTLKKLNAEIRKAHGK